MLFSPSEAKGLSMRGAIYAKYEATPCPPRSSQEQCMLDINTYGLHVPLPGVDKSFDACREMLFYFLLLILIAHSQDLRFMW
jgi:hypothetical protein